MDRGAATNTMDGIWSDGAEIRSVEVEASIRVASHVLSEYHATGLRGVAIVDDLLRTDVFRIEGKYAVSEARASLGFPMSFLGGSRLRLDVLMFHVLAGRRPLHEHVQPTAEAADEIDKERICEGMSYVLLMATRIVSEVAGRRVLTRAESALLRTAGFFWDLIGVPPRLSAAARIGIPSVQIVMARAAHLLGMMYMTAIDFHDVVRRIETVPWRVRRGTVFWEQLESAIIGCDVPVRWVHLVDDAVPERKPLRPRQMGSTVEIPVSMTIDNTVGLLVTPGDKLVLAMVLLFSTEHNAVLVEEAAGREYGIPEVLLEILKRYKRWKIGGVVHSPWYYGKDDTL
jgi:hypothetical protein